MNIVLKEVHKHMRTLEGLRDKGVTIFSVEDSKTLINRLKAIVDMIVADKVNRKEKVSAMSGQLDEEDLEYFEENLESVDKGMHHIMEIVGCLMQNAGKKEPEVSAMVGDLLLPTYASLL